MWFHYRQNNSGGDHVFDEDSGITKHVLIEADTADAANTRAVSIGLYWDGVDCHCCGDRWYIAHGDGMEEPLIYGESVRNYKDYAWMKDGKEIALHYADGQIEWFGVVAEK